MTDNLPIDMTQIELDDFDHPAWDEPVICRVEVDLPAWLNQLTGDRHWEVMSEDEEDNCVSFIMRQPKKVARQAEVTLYNNGYAVVDVDGQSLFDGTLTTGTSDCAQLNYFNSDGEEILLN